MTADAPLPHAVARLLRPGGTRRAASVPAEARAHVVTLLCHVLHADCVQWSWTQHHPMAHRAEAQRIVGSLVTEGWGPSGHESAPTPGNNAGQW